VTTWIDTHCHLDASEFAADRTAAVDRAKAGNVRHGVLPAVCVGNFDVVRELAHAHQWSYGLGIHPLLVPRALSTDLDRLDAELAARAGDERLVAVGEIGIDLFVAELKTDAMRERQEQFFRAQLRLSIRHGLPVLLHVRRSADRLLRHLRELAPSLPGNRWHGIAHAFNGSEQQAHEFFKLGFKLGFGGAMTFDTARQLRRLARDLPLSAIVLETDSPDIPPQWLYRTAGERAGGQVQGRNEPAELPRIGAQLAALRGIGEYELACATTANALEALPKLQALMQAEALSPC
jgi:TatD DNase family protein